MSNIDSWVVQLAAALAGRDGWVRLDDTAASRAANGHWGLVELAETDWRWTHRVAPSGQVADQGGGTPAECVAAVEARVGA